MTIFLFLHDIQSVTKAVEFAYGIKVFDAGYQYKEES
jgi:hypothetical protein